MSKMKFIIRRYLDGPIRVEKRKILLKTYTHRCEPAKGSRGNLASQTHRVANFVGEANLFFG